MSEHLLKMSLEDLREFLQEKIGESIYLNDDLVIEHLKVSMNELRKMKLDLPPPGSQIFLHMISYCIKIFNHLNDFDTVYMFSHESHFAKHLCVIVNCRIIHIFNDDIIHIFKTDAYLLKLLLCYSF